MRANAKFDRYLRVWYVVVKRNWLVRLFSKYHYKVECWVSWECYNSHLRWAEQGRDNRFVPRIFKTFDEARQYVAKKEGWES